MICYVFHNNQTRRCVRNVTNPPNGKSKHKCEVSRYRACFCLSLFCVTWATSASVVCSVFSALPLLLHVHFDCHSTDQCYPPGEVRAREASLWPLFCWHLQAGTVTISLYFGMICFWARFRCRGFCKKMRTRLILCCFACLACGREGQWYREERGKSGENFLVPVLPYQFLLVVGYDVRFLNVS